MDSIIDMKKYVSTLVETNRALADDLDACRRLAASLGAERDDLRRRVAELSKTAVAASRSPEVIRLHGLLAAHQRELSELRVERDALLHDADEPRQRLARAEERIASLTLALNRMDESRANAEHELEVATEAMSEIRDHLLHNLQGIGAAEGAPPDWD